MRYLILLTILLFVSCSPKYTYHKPGWEGSPSCPTYDNYGPVKRTNWRKLRKWRRTNTKALHIKQRIYMVKPKIFIYQT